jgi:myo-inositol 2-dehydrogenase / D-chiro-inositol 1-dehydrogenase
MSTLTRRSFLTTSAAGAALLGVPASVYRSALLAADAPSERVRVGMIGVGNQGGPKNNLKYFQKNVVALCDVDTNYIAESAKFLGTNPTTYSDYRKLLDAKDVDAVVVTVPDHWHALMTTDACKAGKDVYCEKPLSLVISEGRVMVDVARKTNRVVQTGSHQRSGKEFINAVRLVRAGAIGKVKTVEVGLPGPNWIARAKTPVADAAPPAGLDFERWLGPAPARPFNANRVHYLFRFYWDYSGGQQTNFGAHYLDIAQWGLGMDDSGPVAIEGKATFHPQGWYETPDTAEITYTYADGVELKCYLGHTKEHPEGTTFVGEKGKIFVGRGKLTSDPKEIVAGAEMPKKGEPVMNFRHVANFLDCVKTRKRPVADVEIGHRSATVCHLGNIAVRTGRKIVWDPAKEAIVGDAEAAKWLTKEYRKPWSLG